MNTDLVVPEVVEELAQVPANLFGTSDPVAVVEQSSKIASALADVLKKKGLAKKISGREFVLVEGWTLLGTMLGVFPVVQWTRKLEDGWEARVEARTLSGQVVGAAEAECLRSEKNWGNRDDYALRSMAQTRAVSKALRGPLGFIVQLAGFSPTPAEEIPPDESLSERAEVSREEPSYGGENAENSAGDSPIARSESDQSVTKKAARERLSFALKDLAAVPVPADVTFDNWADFAQSAMKERYGITDSKKLSVAQLDDLTSYLRSFDDIPLTR
jgi:hypothetical protein